MSFVQLYISPEGRIGRATWWWAVGVMIAITFPLAFLDAQLGAQGRLAQASYLLTAWPSISVTIKRLHDCDRSGWWNLIGIVPFVGGLLLMAVCGTREGTIGPNRFGPDSITDRTR